MTKKPVNQALADFLLKHSHYIERFANGTVEELVEIYARARPAVLRMIRDLEDFGTGQTLPFRLQRLRSMLNEMSMVLKYHNDQAVKALTERLSQYASHEAATQATMLGAAAGAIGVDIAAIPVETVLAMVHTPLGGATFAERMIQRYGELLFDIKRELTQSVVMGEGAREAAGRLFGVGARMGGMVGNRLRQQAEVIARTEILRVNNEVRDAVYGANRDVVKGVRYLATLDHKTCPVCGVRDGGVFIYGVNDPTPEDLPISGTHPNCFIDHQIPIYTSKGYKPIGKIVVGDLVLTHKGHFKRVTHLVRNKVKSPEVISLKVTFSKFSLRERARTKTITMTLDHPVLINGSWKKCSEVQVGDSITYLASNCDFCGKPIPDGFKFCSRSCLSKSITEKQWSNEEHRKLISEKASKQMKREYETKIRDPYKITKAANKKVRELVKFGSWNHLPRLYGEDNPAKRLDVREKISVSKLGEKNPMRKYPGLRKHLSRFMKNFLLENPGKSGPHMLAKNGYISNLEWLMMASFKEINLSGWEHQYPINRFFVDFAFPEQKVIVECDGAYWHKDKKKDQIRDKKIRSLGWSVFRLPEKDIKADPMECAQEIARVIKNHKGDYSFLDCKVTEVKRWTSNHKGRWQNTISTTLYNLSVEDDESYIAKGFVVHNCRCIMVPILKSWEELGVTGVVPPGPPKPRIFRYIGPKPLRGMGPMEQYADPEMWSGYVTDKVGYNDWLRGIDREDPAFVRDVLGPRRYAVWKEGGMDLERMVSGNRVLRLGEM